jgi:hypothetical protein
MTVHVGSHFGSPFSDSGPGAQGASCTSSRWLTEVAPKRLTGPDGTVWVPTPPDRLTEDIVRRLVRRPWTRVTIERTPAVVSGRPLARQRSEQHRQAISAGRLLRGDRLRRRLLGVSGTSRGRPNPSRHSAAPAARHMQVLLRNVVSSIRLRCWWLRATKTPRACFYTA